MRKCKVGGKKPASTGGLMPNLFIGGITPLLGVFDIREYLSAFGSIEWLDMPQDPITLKWKGYAKARLASDEGLELLLSQASHYVKGIEVFIKPWVNKKEYLKSKDEVSRRKLFVKFQPMMTKGQLFRHFSRYGSIQNIELKFDPLTRQPRFFGYIVFQREEDAHYASIKGSISEKTQFIWCSLTTPKFILDKEGQSTEDHKKMNSTLSQPSLLQETRGNRHDNSPTYLKHYAQVGCTLSTFVEGPETIFPLGAINMRDRVSSIYLQADDRSWEKNVGSLAAALPTKASQQKILKFTNSGHHDGLLLKNIKKTIGDPFTTYSKSSYLETTSLHRHKPTSNKYFCYSRDRLIQSQEIADNLRFRIANKVS